MNWRILDHTGYILGWHWSFILCCQQADLLSRCALGRLLIQHRKPWGWVSVLSI